MAKPTAKKAKTNTGQAISDLLKQQEKLIKSGLLKEELRNGVRYLSWSTDAFPSPTPREVRENSERHRIAELIRLHPGLARPLDGLETKIEPDNGRLRLWLEIKEDTSAKSILKNFSDLSWRKARLVEFDKQHDPLPHPIPEILKQLNTQGKSIATVAKEINAWIATRMIEWEKANSSRRQWIDGEVAGVLMHFGFSYEQSDKIMNDATTKIRSHRYPFLKTETPKGDEGVVLPRDGYPITRELLKSYRRTWLKKQ